MLEILSTPAYEEIAHGVLFEALHDGRIVVFTLRCAERASIDLWTDYVIDTMTNWDRNTPYLALYDMSYAQLTLTPQMKKNADRIAKANPDLSGKAAMLLERNFFSRIFQLFLDREISHSINQLERRLFFEKSRALAWLETDL